MAAPAWSVKAGEHRSGGVVRVDAYAIEATQHENESAQLGFDDGERLLDVRIEPHIAEQQLHVAERDRERPVGIVPDTAHQFDDRVQPLVVAHDGHGCGFTTLKWSPFSEAGKGVRDLTLARTGLSA